MPHGCKYGWNGYYQGPGRLRRHSLPGRAHRVQKWSVRLTRPSCRGRSGRFDHLDLVGLVGPSVPTSPIQRMRPRRLALVCLCCIFPAMRAVMLQTWSPFRNPLNQFSNYCGLACFRKNKNQRLRRTTITCSLRSAQIRQGFSTCLQARHQTVRPRGTGTGSSITSLGFIATACR